MRQVPNYLLIGNGRVSRHLQHYLTLLKIPFTVWHRALPLTELHEKSKASTHILILLSDNAIESFYLEHLQQVDAYCIHFSGSLVLKNIYGAHPLMTFGHELYPAEDYASIYFVIDDDAPSYENLLPGLPNPHARLQKNLKAKYHALCVLSGNFSCMLWQKLFSHLENEFNIPQSAAHPYLRQQTKNILADYQSALTGPLVRNDTNTIKKNLSALSGDAFEKIYQSFVSCYQQLKNEGHL
jgi:predicted short-subunit dehydrogenase-like oxidoreductase (DUF2520 family)